MNVTKAKNLTIVFFVILNLILLSLNYLNNRRYQLSDKQQNYIKSLLSENGINLYTNIISDFRPVRQLLLNQQFMDINYVADWLFDEGEEISRVDEFDKVVLSSQEKRLSYDNRLFTLDIPSGTQKIVLNLQNAKQLCEKKLEELNNQKLNFKFDTETQVSEDSITLEYRLKYQDYTVYSSYVRFKITQNGITQIKCVLLSCDGYVDAAKEIYSSDEALQSLLYELKNIYGSNPSLIISRMDMVHYIEFSKTDESPDLRTIPYYRFYIAGRQEPFLINAYFNTILS